MSSVSSTFSAGSLIGLIDFLIYFVFRVPSPCGSRTCHHLDSVTTGGCTLAAPWSDSSPGPIRQEWHAGGATLMPLFSSSCSALENNYIKARRKNKKHTEFVYFFGGVFASTSALFRSLVVFLQKTLNYIN
jgi:hypothetical protein